VKFVSLCAAAVGLAAAFGIARSAAQTPAEHGKAVYAAHCVECHGPEGRGDGPAAPVLTPRPRDFSEGRFKIRSTESGQLPTDADLVRSVGQGLPGSAMPAWAAVLPDADIRDVVTYIKTFSDRFTSEQPAVVVPGDDIPASPESVARGAHVYETLKCASCHGTDGRGTGAIARDFRDDWNQPLRAANLTEPWTFHGGETPRDIYLRFRTGMSGTPMPSFVGTATNDEMWDLANYVASLARKPVWSMTADEINQLYAREADAAKRDPVARGRYLADTHLCAACHSPLDANGKIVEALKMAGGQVIRIEPYGDFPTGNLTSDKDTGLGSWTDAEIKRTLTTGILRNGERLPPYPMDWSSFSALTSDDLHALVAYLRTIPPIANRVPPIARTPLPTYLVDKFRLLILGQDFPLVILSGNAGTAGTGAAR
jgi:cbb3-type cytochrome c oxidase subunit III